MPLVFEIQDPLYTIMSVGSVCVIGFITGKKNSVMSLRFPCKWQRLEKGAEN